jgi:hypothetical protein
MTPDPKRGKALFRCALQLPVAERGAFLHHACRGDGGVRRRVDELLAALVEAGGFLGGTGDGAADDRPPAGPAAETWDEPGASPTPPPGSGRTRSAACSARAGWGPSGFLSALDGAFLSQNPDFWIKGD